jgi:hypothetical protein
MPGMYNRVFVIKACVMNVVIAGLNLVFIFSLSWVLFRRENNSKIFLPALVFKLGAGIALGLLYTWHYAAADTFNYFNDGAILGTLAREDFTTYVNFIYTNNTAALHTKLYLVDPRALFFSKFTSFFNLITNNNYWIISLYFSFLSFIATWFLFKKIKELFPSCGQAAAMAFLFFPSVVFWTSGLIKESLSMTCLSFLSILFLKFWFNQKLKIYELIIALLIVWIEWNIKYYFAAVFFSVLLTGIFYKFIFVKIVKPENIIASCLLWFVIFLLPLLLVSFLHPNFYPERFLNVIVSNNRIFHTVSLPGNLIQFFDLRPNWSSIIVNVPIALISGLFRPFIWDAGNFLQIISAIENLIIGLFFLTALSRFNSWFRSPHRLLTLSVIVYVCVLCIFITLSTPNFGTLSRYRTGYLPFFLFIILCENPLIRKLQTSFPNLVP